MLRSKSRSGSVDIGTKNHYSSVFSRTLSASKLCRGDALGSQIDGNALKSIDKKPSKISNSSENWIRKFALMQQQMGELEEELKRTKEKLSVSELEKDEALDQLREAQEEANMRLNEAFSPKKAKELIMELEHLKGLLVSSRDELKVKEKKIESLEIEKDASLKEFREVREKEKELMDLLLKNKRKIQELEVELEKEKESKSQMAYSFDIQTKELEESKIEIVALHDKILSFEESSSKENSKEIEGSSSVENGNLREEENRSLKFELQMTKESLSQVQESEKKASLKAKSLLDEMELLKNELEKAIDAEEKSKKAMDDLALALKEVATEANQAKETVTTTQIELEHVKGEAEQLKTMVRSIEERYQKRLEEAKQEADLHKNTSERLRLEAEEALLAWNGKEMGFVSCIKRAEEERAIAQHEKLKILESLKAAENMTRAAREETYKLRDILKQAVNEANAAKAAAGIARDENSVLKDCLAEKEESLLFLTRENERLRINEAAAHENVKQFKRMLSTASVNEDDGILNPSEKENNKIKKNFSFDLEDLKFMNEPENEKLVLDEDPEKAEALRGSIFDTNSETPKSEPHTPKSHQRGSSSSAFTDCDSKDFEGENYDSDSERNSSRRMRTMFKRVGDLLMIRRGFAQKGAIQ